MVAGSELSGVYESVSKFTLMVFETEGRTRCGYNPIYTRQLDDHFIMTLLSLPTSITIGSTGTNVVMFARLWATKETIFQRARDVVNTIGSLLYSRAIDSARLFVC